jgi:putative transposase
MYRFSKGARFSWHEAIYEVLHAQAGQEVQLVDLASGAISAASEGQLLDALFDGTLTFVIAGQANAEELLATQAFPTLADCSLRQQLTARYRYWVIEPLVALPKEARTLEAVTKRLAEVEKALDQGAVPIAVTDERHGLKLRTRVSTTTIYRWVRTYEEAGGDIRSLIPNWHKRGRRRYLQPTVDQIVTAVIDELYLQRERQTVDDVHLEVLLRVEEANANQGGEVLRAPGRGTIYNRIRHLDAKEKTEARQGKRAARRAMTQYGMMDRPDRPLMRVEIDHTPVDVILVDAEDGLPLGRPTLTSVLDIATRYPLGYYLGFEPPSYLAVCEALTHAFKPKGDVRGKYGTAHEWIAYGLPRTLVVDNGREFKGQSLEDACLSLGIMLQFTPKMTPHFKGGVERLFRTQNMGLFHALEGTTFSNIFARGDYRSLEVAKLTLHDIDSALHIFLLDFYAEQFHTGLPGIPARRWEQFLADGFRPRLPANVADVDILLGRVLYRTLFHYGVEIDGLRYNHSDLAPLRDQLKRGEKVKIKYHPGDISQVYIHNPFDQRYICAPAVNQIYALGLSRWKHQLIRAFLREERGRVNQQGLAWAKRKMREIVAEAKERKRGRTRKREARWQTNGRSAQNIPADASSAPPPDSPEPPILPEPASPPDITEQVPPSLANMKLTFTAEELEAEGWRTSRR